MPGVHVPYLLGLGVIALTNAASIYVPAPTDGGDPHPILYVMQAAQFTAIVLHLSWVSTLFKDAERFLGTELPMPPTRVVAVTMISCLLMPVWSAFAFMVLLRASVNVVEAKGRGRSPPALVRAADDAPALVLAGLVWVGLHAVVLIQLDRAGMPQGRYADVLGDTGAALVATMHLACTGYWLWFIARTVPALYRGYGTLEPAAPRDTGPDSSP